MKIKDDHLNVDRMYLGRNDSLKLDLTIKQIIEVLDFF